MGRPGGASSRSSVSASWGVGGGRFTGAVLGVGSFFFRAEDGIRDHCETGVQTCALPISGAAVGGDLRIVLETAGGREGDTVGIPLRLPRLIDALGVDIIDRTGPPVLPGKDGARETVGGQDRKSVV